MTMWVVLDDDDDIVLLASGRDAPHFVEEWAADGYQVLCVDAEDDIDDASRGEAGVHAA
jgi:hypothetical protein